jgi:hypothetical protein
MDAAKSAGGAVLALLVLFTLMALAAHIHMQPAEAENIPDDPPDSAGEALWDDRGMDVVFQMAIILAGAFGVLALVRGVTGRD